MYVLVIYWRYVNVYLELEAGFFVEIKCLVSPIFLKLNHIFLFLFQLLASSQGSGKHPQLIPSTPRWAVANGAGVILSVCDEEVARYETATLTAVAVPALLLPPPTTALDEHLVAGLPALEPYARLFHRYGSGSGILSKVSKVCPFHFF